MDCNDTFHKKVVKKLGARIQESGVKNPEKHCKIQQIYKNRFVHFATQGVWRAVPVYNHEHVNVHDYVDALVVADGFWRILL
jgi:hypothetical protein